MQKARLENWYLGEDDRLYGEVYGHPKISDGIFVHTSRLVKYDKENNQAITQNTEYVLGKPILTKDKK